MDIARRVLNLSYSVINVKAFNSGDHGKGWYRDWGTQYAAIVNDGTSHDGHDLIIKWCERGESNPYGLLHWILRIITEKSD